MSRNSLLGYLFSIATAVAWGAATVVIRRSVSDGSSPLGGAVVSLFFGGVVLGLMSLGQYDRHLRRQGRAIALFAISGLLSGFGVLAFFYALDSAPVMVVAPISNTTPLITMIIVQLFLRGLEHMTPRIWLGGLLVMVGVVIISLGQYL